MSRTSIRARFQAERQARSQTIAHHGAEDRRRIRRAVAAEWLRFVEENCGCTGNIVELGDEFVVARPAYGDMVQTIVSHTNLPFIAADFKQRLPRSLILATKQPQAGPSV
jgi:hypothetical protein